MTTPPDDDSPRRLRLVVVDDNELARAGVQALLATQPDFSVVAEAGDGTAGLAAFREHKPHVMLVDLRMPKLDGVQLTAALVRENPPGRVLVLTHYDGDESIFNALRAGALGYLTKDARRADLFQAVREVAAGRRYLPGPIAARLADRMLQPSLTPRELQVLALIFKGQSNRDIGKSLKIAEKTVIMYVGNILEKMGAKSRTEAVALALQRGILDVD